MEPDQLKVSFRLKTWHRAVVLAAFVLLAAAAFTWICRHDPSINFLPGDGRADWVLFPRPVHPASHPIVTLDTLFRREFSVSQVPVRVELRIRAARQVDLRINDVTVNLPPVRHWKNEAVTDIGPLLRVGSNSIEARVFNNDAPAALWLAAAGDGFALCTEAGWEASITGSAWRPVALASTARFPGPGNPMAGGERIRQTVGTVWPIELTFALVAVALCAVGILSRSYWQTWTERRPALSVFLVLGLAAAIWLLLFINNAFLLPFRMGFDSGEHANYIKYIQERRALPPATAGYEMFQAPLFYVLSALVVGACGFSPADGTGLLLLRGLTTCFGVAQFVFVFLTVRLLFPRRLLLQLVGLLLAAFLPVQLYLSHNVTNEALAALLASVSLYFALRLTRTEDASALPWLFFGLIVGAALLTKATTLLLVPPLFLMLGARLWSTRWPARLRLRNFAGAIVAMLAVSGWFYISVWHRFGTPLLGNWDLASGFPWWQDPGYRVAADYFRFGRSLEDPLFSSLNGFADGIYSTLWGDGLCSGVADLTLRPPWNYGLMVCGYLWAIVPTLLILTGATVALWRFIRQPSFDYFVMLAVAAAVACGILFMTLKVACFGQIKAFYGLSALIPFCVFGVIGWEVATRTRPLRQFLVGSLLLIWAMNSVASFWILRSPAYQVSMARRLQAEDRREAALSEMEKAMASNPRDADALSLLASLLEEAGRPAEALTQARRAVEMSPRSPASHLHGSAKSSPGGATPPEGPGKRGARWNLDRKSPPLILFF